MPTVPARPASIELNAPFIPFDDLPIRGDQRQYYRIPQDIQLNFAMLIGYYNGIPKIVPVSEDGSLVVAQSVPRYKIVCAEEGALLAGTSSIPCSFHPEATKVIISTIGGYAVLTLGHSDGGSDNIINIPVNTIIELEIPFDIITVTANPTTGITYSYVAMIPRV